MKPTVCVSFEVPHGPTGSPCCQNRNRILSRAARLRKPNTKRVRNGRNGARSDVSGPRMNGFLSRLDSFAEAEAEAEASAREAKRPSALGPGDRKSGGAPGRSRHRRRSARGK